MRIAIVASQFNEALMDLLLQGTQERLGELGISENSITVVRVPGSVEIPIAAQRLARTEKYAAIISLGIVIRGETTHYDYVCSQVSEGCQRVSLDYNIPVVFGVLTTENTEQALARLGGAQGHQGRYAADVAVNMVKILKNI